MGGGGGAFGSPAVVRLARFPRRRLTGAGQGQPPGRDTDAGDLRDQGPGDAGHDGDVGDDERFDCARRTLLGQGATSDWVRRTAGFNTCVWRGSGPDPTTDCRHFDTVWARPWPGNAVTMNLFMEGNEGRQFIALEFDSGNIPFDHQGALTQEVPQFGGASSATKLWSISRCPGDFNKDLVDAEMGPGCVREDEFGITQAFSWGGPASANVDDLRRCALQPNTRYFLNIVFTQDEAGTAPEEIQPHPRCVSARCGVPVTATGGYSP